VTEKMHPGMREFYSNVMIPALYSAMQQTPYQMCPYPQLYGDSPDDGIVQPEDPPRFCAGYSSLFDNFSFLNETHVYKPFPDQVKATYYLMRAFLAFTSGHAREITGLRKRAIENTCRLDEYAISWELDTTRFDMLYFKGYAYKKRRSELTGQIKNYYDRKDPWEKNIPFFKYHRPKLTVKVPHYFIIPQAWDEVIRRLALNRIEMYRLEGDTTLPVEAYHIEYIRYADGPYNGHFRHDSIRARSDVQDIRFYTGDVIVPLNQPGNKYLMEMLDPRGEDSFMRWNFFDPILERREYIDPSTFEERAEKILEVDPELRSRFEKLKSEDPAFNASDLYQMYFIYTNSQWAEPTYRRYPVYRLMSRD
jgi:hypothetical protein